MISLKIDAVKDFMNKLLKEDVFDNLEVRKIEINTFTKFDISCIIDKNYFTLAEQEFINRKYCIWKELKPLVFQLLKGNRLPISIKLVFSFDQKATELFDENASALFINIVFENNELNCFSGCSEKNFSFDKKLENEWDEYVKGFIQKMF